jgi:hypothetical protein
LFCLFVFCCCFDYAVRFGLNFHLALFLSLSH